jgi:hypothetical protein
LDAGEKPGALHVAGTKPNAPRGNNTCVGKNVDQRSDHVALHADDGGARAAGVSIATASLALRNQPKFPMETAARVRHAAAELGYQPHPSVSALMAHIRAGRRPGSREKIAFGWVEAGTLRPVVVADKKTSLFRSTFLPSAALSFAAGPPASSLRRRAASCKPSDR